MSTGLPLSLATEGLDGYWPLQMEKELPWPTSNHAKHVTMRRVRCNEQSKEACYHAHSKMLTSTLMSHLWSCRPLLLMMAEQHLFSCMHSIHICTGRRIRRCTKPRSPARCFCQLDMPCLPRGRSSTCMQNLKLACGSLSVCRWQAANQPGTKQPQEGGVWHQAHRARFFRKAVLPEHGIEMRGLTAQFLVRLVHVRK